jgi:RNA polymerase-binding transcription factor DksA
LRFSDPIDQGTDLAAKFVAESVRVQAAKSRPQQVKDANGRWPITLCVSCGDDIVPKRLEYGYIRCIECQTDLEKEEKRHGSR